MKWLKDTIKLLLVGFLIMSSSCDDNGINNNFNDELTYPVNLRVSFDEDTESATITWDPVVGATGYTVWYAFTETSTYTLLADVTTNEYNDESIDRESQKFYKVKSYKGDAESIYSVPVSVTNYLLLEKAATVRAMWVWDKTAGLESDKRAELFTFCKERNIGLLYFTTGTNDYSTDADLKQSTREFVRDAHNNNILVHGLTGYSAWILPDRQYKYLDAVRSIVAYNNSVEEDERFDGYQSDIEPNAYVGTKYELEERIQNLGYYVDVHKQAADIFDEGLKDRENFDYGMALSAFYDSHAEELKFEYNGKTQLTLYHVAEIVDYFAIMSYRDKATSIINISETEVNLMESLGKKAWAGVETIDTEAKGGDPSSINFAHEGNIYMEEEIAKVKANYEYNLGFGGIAIHHYTTYCVLQD